MFAEAEKFLWEGIVFALYLAVCCALVQPRFSRTATWAAGLGAAAAVCAMGLAGELAWGRMAPGEGNASYRTRIIDAVFLMDGNTLDKGARYEIG